MLKSAQEGERIFARDDGTGGRIEPIPRPRQQETQTRASCQNWEGGALGFARPKAAS
jgi:hypothetical protein